MREESFEGATLRRRRTGDLHVSRPGEGRASGRALLSQSAPWDSPWVLAAGAVVLLAVVQWTTAAETLTEHDSVNLFRGFRDYNPALDQPHPPGYPLVVLAAHAFGWVGGAIDAYLAVALVSSLAAVAATYLLGRAMFGHIAGLVSATLLAATPLFLYYLGIVSVYPAEAAAAPILALIAYRVATCAGAGWSLALFPALALAGGFRPTIIGLMLPMCGFAVYMGRPSLRHLAVSAAVGSLIVVAWAAPMLAASGGWDAYWAESSRLYGSAAESSSIFHGAGTREVSFNAGKALSATFVVSLPALAALAGLALLGQRPRFPRNAAAWGILAAWVIPYLSLFALVHFGKPGYVLAYMPAINLAAGGLLSSRRRAPIAAVTILALMVAFFYAAPNLPLSKRIPSFMPTADSIDVADTEARGLAAVSNRCEAPDCTIVSLPSSERWWRRTPYSLAGAYATESTVIPVEDLGGSKERLAGETLWVGDLIPAPVRSHARLVRTIGPWAAYRANPRQTRRIEGESTGQPR